jgi:hypothetical protein
LTEKIDYQINQCQKETIEFLRQRITDGWKQDIFKIGKNYHGQWITDGWKQDIFKIGKNYHGARWGDNIQNSES